ncbi:hypothetical protein D3C72_2253040 [compost metagenome]
MITEADRSCDTADAPDRASPATTARMVAKATAEMKPRNRSPPTALARWIAAMLLPPISWVTSLPFLTTVSIIDGCSSSSMIAPKPMMKVRM